MINKYKNIISERYMSEEEKKESILRSATAIKIIESQNRHTKNVFAERATKVKINGVVYETIRGAMGATGITRKRMLSCIEKLANSKRSTIQFEIRTAKSFEFEKIKDHE